MFKNLYVTLAVILFFISCDQTVKTVKKDDPLEAGREFIDASLKGDYEYAKKYLLPDTTNAMYFERLQDFYKNKDKAEKDGYKNANIIINSAEKISDSVMIINYSNTFKNQPAKIKLIKLKNEWLVDFKYTFSGNL